MKKGINLTLNDDDLIELIRVMLDDDEKGALAFLKLHFRGKARELLGGG